MYLSTAVKTDGENTPGQSTTEDAQKPVQVTVAQAEQPVFQNVENVPVKVADAAQAVDTASADMDALYSGYRACGTEKHRR